MENYDQIYEQVLKIQTETLKKAQAEIGLKTESVKLKAAKWAIGVAVISLVAAITTYINNAENQQLKARISALEDKK